MERCANGARIEALWRDFIWSDPDLRAMELRKRSLSHKHRRKAAARAARVTRRKELRTYLLRTAGTVIFGVLIAAALALAVVALA